MGDHSYEIVNVLIEWKNGMDLFPDLRMGLPLHNAMGLM